MLFVNFQCVIFLNGAFEIIEMPFRDYLTVIFAYVGSYLSILRV